MSKDKMNDLNWLNKHIWNLAIEKAAQKAEDYGQLNLARDIRKLKLD
jgi:hypothetical protein